MWRVFGLVAVSCGGSARCQKVSRKQAPAALSVQTLVPVPMTGQAVVVPVWRGVWRGRGFDCSCNQSRTVKSRRQDPNAIARRLLNGSVCWRWRYWCTWRQRLHACWKPRWCPFRLCFWRVLGFECSWKAHWNCLVGRNCIGAEIPAGRRNGIDASGCSVRGSACVCSDDEASCGYTSFGTAFGGGVGSGAAVVKAGR